MVVGNFRLRPAYHAQKGGFTHVGEADEAHVRQGRDPVADFDAINLELKQYSPELAERPQIGSRSR